VVEPKGVSIQHSAFDSNAGVLVSLSRSFKVKTTFFLLPQVYIMMLARLIVIITYTVASLKHGAADELPFPTATV
jgi:long-subunit acyl-CoA synthetase (AMP-forming)